MPANTSVCSVGTAAPSSSQPDLVGDPIDLGESLVTELSTAAALVAVLDQRREIEAGPSTSTRVCASAA